MNQTIKHALDAICLERDDQKYASSFEAASALILEFGEEDLAERIFKEIPRTVPFELVAELFELLTWQTNDNGGAIHAAIEMWLRAGDDNRRNLIALNLGVYPFTDEAEMNIVLSQLSAKSPRVAARCKYLIESRPRPNRAT